MEFLKSTPHLFQCSDLHQICFNSLNSLYHLKQIVIQRNFEIVVIDLLTNSSSSNCWYYSTFNKWNKLYRNNIYWNDISLRKIAQNKPNCKFSVGIFYLFSLLVWSTKFVELFFSHSITFTIYFKSSMLAEFLLSCTCSRLRWFLRYFWILWLQVGKSNQPAWSVYRNKGSITKLDVNRKAMKSLIDRIERFRVKPVCVGLCLWFGATRWL